MLDAGANCGIASRIAARLWPNATIVSLEPDPDNFAILSKNFEGVPGLHPEMVRFSLQFTHMNLELSLL